MLTDILRRLFARDLHKLEHEIEQYENERTIWHFEKGIANSAGNLCLHVVGNLKTYIVLELGGVEYVRNRDLEFSLKDVPRVELLATIKETSILVDTALASLPESELQKESPLLVLEEKTSTEYFLVHLASHLAYHLGQVNYHRRLLDV